MYFECNLVYKMKSKMNSEEQGEKKKANWVSEMYNTIIQLQLQCKYASLHYVIQF